MRRRGRDAVVQCDPDMITQAIINIMSNAMRYTPEGGWVVVSVKTDKRDVLVAVSDTGIGIAKEDLPRIFSRFWRADASRAREAGGLGVGLSLTQQNRRTASRVHSPSTLSSKKVQLLRFISRVSTRPRRRLLQWNLSAARNSCAAASITAHLVARLLTRHVLRRS